MGWGFRRFVRARVRRFNEALQERAARGESSSRHTPSAGRTAGPHTGLRLTSGSELRALKAPSPPQRFLVCALTPALKVELRQRSLAQSRAVVEGALRSRPAPRVNKCRARAATTNKDMARAEHTKPYKHQPSDTTYGQAADAIKRKPRCTIFRRASLSL